jgi:hypothetical protein
MKGGIILDPIAIERAESELNSFINKRARGRDEANAEAKLWAASVRCHKEEQRRVNAQAWAAYYRTLALVHHGLAAENSARADAVEGAT